MFPETFLNKYRQQLSETDFNQFIEYCQKPLRKSIRVNTLKISVADFQKIAQEKKWELEQIPWCESGFWIERENREEPLGKSIEHFLGLFYIQEASSMIPPEILNPRRGEIVLDMAAAPGSKTTQLADKMQNQGVLVSNEPIVKRIKGMVSNLERLGASCAVVSRKEGQFFGENTVNFFDKILLDAPCTGEGTVRKDPKALENWSQENIEGMSRLQKQLIKSAFEALKPNGEMVYSTCTLAKEENEEVVEYLLEEFKGNAELVPFCLVKTPFREQGGVVPQNLEINSSMLNQIDKKDQENKENIKVQVGNVESVEEKKYTPLPLQGVLNTNFLNSKLSILNSTLTLWPQLYDSEGFFVAKIRKKAKTTKIFSKQKKKKHFISKYRVLRNNEVELVQGYLEKHFGYTEKLVNFFKLYQKENQVYFCPKEIREIDKRIYLERRGFLVGEFLHKRNGTTEFKINHLGVSLLGNYFSKNLLELNEKEVLCYLKGENLNLTKTQIQKLENGVIVLKFRKTVLGKGLLQNLRVKNQMPRYLIW